jgi:hypothetical protein
MKISKVSILLFTFVFLLSLLPIGTGVLADTITFTGEELLGRPTDTSISISIVPDEEISVYYEYGTSPGTYTVQTSTEIATGGQPHVVVIDGLTPDTRYYYRMQYSTDSGSTWEARSENSFHTQRAPGSTFTFTVTTDGHVNILLGDASTWANTIDDIIADQPDFNIEMGDSVDMRSISAGDVAGAEESYKFTLPFFNLISGSTPMFILPGNHEQKEGWHLIEPLADSLPVIGTNAEKKYFLNPVPDGFYTGDTDLYPYLTGDQLRQDYYAWTWGDALFVVINPFWYTTTRPYVSDPGGGETDAVGSGDSWDWTLGETQFNWLKTTLENSTAKYKFVFTHQFVGGGNISGQADYGHGGANYSHLCEWGGYNEDGSTWGWDTMRAGWGNLPIHQLLVANGVSAVFHAHDHQYAYEKRDGIVYQEVPAAGFSGNGFNIYTTGDGYTIQALSSSGHLKVTVDPSQTTVDYIRTGETESSYSYDILPASEPVPGTVTLDGIVSSSTADDVSSVNFYHTTGSGPDRLMLVGVSWNCGTTDRSISSVVFNDGTDHPLTEVITQLGYSTSNPRYSAIYSLLNPPSGQTGTVTVTFSGSVSNGIVSGAANFAGVDQTTPLGTPVGNGPSDQDTTQSVTLTGLNGNELVFDNVFQGASGESQTLTAGAGQTQLWNAFAGNTRAASSIEQSTGTSVTMSWTAGSASYRTMVAVPINPAPTESGILGDVNGDDLVNSTDALIILSCDVGIDTSSFCPMDLGDVNSDGVINSTDALIILSYDVGMTVPFPVGEPSSPSGVTPCPGCGP